MNEDFVKRPTNYRDHIDEILDDRLAVADERLLAAVTAALDLEAGLAEIIGNAPRRPVAGMGDDLRATQASGVPGVPSAAPAAAPAVAPAPDARAVVAAGRPITRPGKAPYSPAAGLRARRNQTAPPGRAGKRARGGRRRASACLVTTSPVLVGILVCLFALPHWASSGSADLPVAESTSSSQSPDGGAVHSTEGQENGAGGDDQATSAAGVTQPRNSASGMLGPVSGPAPAAPQPIPDGSAPNSSTGSGTGTGANGGTSDGSPGSGANSAANVTPPGPAPGDPGPGNGADGNDSASSGTVCYVPFAPGQNQLSDRAKLRLRRWLKGAPSSTSQITIAGFDDSDGAGASPGLATSRAQAVADYLHAQDPAAQITVAGEAPRPGAVRRDAGASVTPS